MKRYRLKIPEMIRREDAVSVLVAERIDKNNGGVWLANGDGGDIPSDWLEEVYPCAECGCLRTKAEGGTTFTVCDECWDKAHPKEEIKEEPMSAEEWVCEWVKSHKYIKVGTDLEKTVVTNDELVEIFSAGAAENEKKHRLQQSFDEWERAQPKYYVSDNRNDIFVARKEGWQAHAKATNTEA